MSPLWDPREEYELFHALVDLPPDERRRYLDEYRPGPALRRHVERLLDHDPANQQQPPPDGAPSLDPATAPAARASWEHGEGSDLPVLPGYEILAKLGQGGMGVVYQARQTALKRIVAVKMIRPDVEAGAEQLRRFRTEAEVVARIQHPNIVQIHDVGEHDGRPFLVLEFIDGDSLADRLEGKPWPVPDAAQLLEDLARAVHEAHRHGIVHRDLKPGNVLLPKSTLTPKVSDFGIAKLLLGGPAEQTRTGAVLGTPNYMAPEQARARNKEVGPATDVYALGAILYECLTGRPPFLGETPLDTLRQVVSDEPVAPRQLQPKVPRDLETICLQCLRKEPRRRYASALELADDLRRFLTQQPIRARSVGPLTRLWLGCRRNPGLAVAGGLSVAALVALVVLAVTFGVEQGRLARKAQREAVKAQREAALATWDRGRQLCDAGKVRSGLLLMAQALKTAPSGPEDANLREALRIELAGWHRLCHTLYQAWKHRGKVLALAVSPDRKTVVTGCAKGKVRLWDLNARDPKGHCRCKLAGHKGGVCAAGFSRHGNTFITGGADGKVYLWDAAKERQIGQLQGHVGKVWAVALSPDGALALTGGADKKACLWKLPAGGADKKARLWKLPARACQAILKHSGAVRTVAFSPNGQTFLTGGAKEQKKGNVARGEVRLYETRTAHQGTFVTLRKEGNKEFRRTILSAAFSPPDGKTLLIGDDNWEVTFWDVASRQQLAAADRSNGAIRGIAFAPDGNSALAGIGEAASAHLWDVEGLLEQWGQLKKDGIIREGMGPKQHLPRLPHPAPVTAVAFGRDATQFLTACEDGFVRVWKKASGPRTTKLRHLPEGQEPPDDEEYGTIAFHPSRPLVATAGWDNKVTLWKVPDGAADGELSHPERVEDAVFTPDGKTVVTGWVDSHVGASQVNFWNVKTRQKVGRPLRDPGKELSWLSVSPDGALPLLVLTGYKDGTAQLWDADSRKKIGEPLRHQHPRKDRKLELVTAISPDNKWFLTGGEDRKVRLWDAKGNFIRKRKHRGAVWHVQFSPDGKRMVSASHDGNVCFWDVATGKLLTTLTHRSSVNAVAFAAHGGGKRVLTGGRIEDAQLWDVELRRRVGPSCRPGREAVDVALSPDGKIAVLADSKGYGLLWSLPQPVPDDPERITLWVQVTVGMKLDEGGGRKVLDGRPWLKLRERLKQLGGFP
jgi:WD40 repeat protein/serine/threonine protein kinase